ncbi:MAG: Mur ligase family protein [Christensenellales bacterium]
MSIFNWNNPDLYFLIAISVLNSVVLCFLSYKFLQIIQLSSYKVDKYGTWLKDTKAKWVSRITMLSFLSFACMLVTNFLFNAFQDNKLLGYIGLIFYFTFAIMFAKKMYDIPQKTPLKLTKRMFRLYFLLFVIYLIINFSFLMLSLEYTMYLRVSVISLIPILIPIVVPLASIIIYPFELLINYIYKKACERKLKKHKNLIKIAITGSYGKTSTKFFLKSFLEKKYKVCCSPSSFNTPMGITKVVLNELKDDDEVLIAEMGAIKTGEIKELCKMVKPDAGIITSIGEQHLDTFKTLDNILNTKYELAESLGGESYCVFNCANENTAKLYERCTLKNKVAVCDDEKSLLWAKDIVATEDGLEFVICYKNKEYKAKTKILGEHNIQNILCAGALALKLGLTIKQVVEVIAGLQSAEHRLELKKLDNNVLIIDDSFNSNIQGTAVALKTLKLFDGRRKIVVTPGLVELGKREKVENVELGKRIAKVADIAILVNKNQSENIKQGLLEAGFDEKNIFMQDSLFEVTNQFKTFLKSGDVVLLENDLPDNYK